MSNSGNVTIVNNFFNDSDIAVINAGYQKKVVDHSFGPYANNYHVLQFIIDGKGTLQIGNREWHLKKYDLFYLPANTLCKYYADGSDPYEYFWISFIGRKADEYLQKCCLNNENPICCFDSSALKKPFADIFKYLNSNKSNNTFKILAETYGVFDAIVAQSPLRNTHIKYSPLIQNAIAYMDTHYPQGITVTDVCAYLFVNPSYFSTLFKKSTGITLSDYLMGKRISDATIKLKSTDMNISAIAASIGMTPLAFTAAFKRHYFFTPSEYRNNLEKSVREKPETERR